MKKSTRQALIGELITNNIVTTQEELLSLLAKQGVIATQATISRDIREMRMVKDADEKGNMRYTILGIEDRDPWDKLNDAIASVTISVVQVEFILVITTLASNGNMLAAILDEIQLPEIIGTVAGHDTIIAICQSKEVASELVSKFNEYVLEH